MASNSSSNKQAGNDEITSGPASYKFDDFLIECAPESREHKSDADKKKRIKYLMKYAALQCKAVNQDVNNQPENIQNLLDEIFSMHSQTEKLAIDDEMEDIRQVKEGKILDEAISVLSKNLEKQFADEDIDLKRVQQDFVKHRNILNNVILRVFKSRADEVLFILGDLFQKYFTDENDYLSLDDGNFADDIVNTLLSMGLIECSPDDDTIVRLVKLNC